MARAPKVKETEQISDKEMWDVIEFAKNMYNSYPGVFSPDLVNARLKDVNMNPLSSTENEITEALKNPKNNEQKLRGIGEFFEYTNMVYKRSVLYLGNMLSFDIVPVCINASGKEYNSAQYKKDEAILYDFLDKFDHKQELIKIVRQLVRSDAYYGSFRDEGERYIFQELPTDYCKITSKSEHGFLFDFNMMWFIGRVGVSVDSYSKVFKKYYNRIMDGKNNGYPMGGMDSPRNGEFAYWVQTSQKDGQWCFKFDQELYGQVPFFAPLYADLVNAPLIRNLQKSKYIIEASRILVGLVPMLKDNKSGNVKDMFALSPEAMGKFANLFRQGLSKEIQMAIGPFEKVESIDFHTTDTNMFEAYNKNLTSMSGINSRLLFTTDKANAAETMGAIAVDEMLVTYLYPQFNRFMEHEINKRTEKYKFKVTFEGTNFPTNKKDRQAEALGLANLGIVLPEKIASAFGMSPADMKRMMDKAKATKFVDSCSLLQSTFTQSASGTNGRPRKEDSELSDSGSETRSAGSNLEKGGDI